MEELRLGRPVNLFETDEDNAGDIYLNKQTALKQDVLHAKPPVQQVASVQPPQPETPSLSASAWLHPNQQARQETQTSEDSAPQITAGSWAYKAPEPAKVEQKPAEESGDTARGFSTALNQTPALAKGFVGVVGATGEKAFGEGGMFSGLKKYGLEGYQKDMAAIDQKAKPTDDVTQAWDRAKKGDIGALVDWAQYGIGYLGGNVVETVATSLLGAGIGAAVSGPAAPAGAAAGAVEGAMAKDAVKGVAKTMIENMVAKEAAKLAEKAGVETATDAMFKQATKDVAKGIGSATALAGSNIIKETGGIYGEAVKEKGGDLDAGDLARVWGSGIVAGLSEAAVDKLGLDAAGGKFKIPGGGRAGRALVGGAIGAGVEGGQELFQTAIERFGAAQSLTGEDAMRDYINSFALGGLGGGTVGSVVGAFRNGKIDRSRAEQIIGEAQKDLTGEDGRQELFHAMMGDEQMSKVLQANGIESGDDPKFQSVVTRTLATQRLLASLEMPTVHQRAETRKRRQEDVQAAFGETASTGVGVGMGEGSPLIQRDSVTPNQETRTLEGEAKPVMLPEGQNTPGGTLALSPEDLVARQQNFEVEKAFSVGGKTRGNGFVSLPEAQTFLFGPINKATGSREGGYSSTVEDRLFRIRQGKRSKAEGGGTFYFVESREKPQEVNTAGFVTEPTAQAQAQVDAVKEGRKNTAFFGLEEAKDINADGLIKVRVLDPETGNYGFLFTKNEGLAKGAQRRINDVGFKQAVGEMLDYVEPEKTSGNSKGNEVVVQQTDNKTGQIISEQAVSPENVSKVAPIPDTTVKTTTAEEAIKERQQPQQTETQKAVEDAAAQSATNPNNELPQPTDGQKKAGNYKKGIVRIAGMEIAIENPTGSERSGTDASGKAWRQDMQHHYGYIKGSKGADKDHVDVFIGPNPDSNKVFVVDQINPDGSFDEHKVMLGFDTIEEAEAGYYANYEKGWTGMGAISEMPLDAFKSWVTDGVKKKPLSYKAPDVSTNPEKTNTSVESVPAKEVKKNEPSRATTSKDSKAADTESKAAEDAPAKTVKAAKQAKPDTKTKKLTAKELRQQAIESWEDNDDGEVAHIPFVKLSKEAQDDWMAATHPEEGERPYNTAELHDKIVEREARNKRTERANKKADENRKAAEPDFSRKEESGRVFTYGQIKSVEDLNKSVQLMQERAGEKPDFKASRLSVGTIVGRVPGIGLIEKTAASFGKPVVFFEVTSGEDFFDGAVIPGSDTIFVNVNASRPHLRIVGHELVHAIRNSDPKTYQRLVNALLPMLDEPGMIEYAVKQSKAGVRNQDKILEEAIGDIVGDRFGEQEFWRMLSQENPTAFQKLAQIITDFINNTLAKLQGKQSLGSETLVTDLKAARKQIAQVLSGAQAQAAKEMGIEQTREHGNLTKAVNDDAVAFARKRAEPEDPRDPNFLAWFDESHTTDSMGRPVAWYHGTAQNISVFRAKQAGAIFITPEPRFAEGFSYESQHWMAKNYWKVLDEAQVKAAREEAYAAIRKDYKKTKQDREYAETLIEEIEDDNAHGESEDYLMAAIVNHMPSGPNIMPVYVRSVTPFDYENESHRDEVINALKQQEDFDPSMIRMYINGLKNGEWTVIEMPDVQEAIKTAGHDSFYVSELGVKNLAVYQPNQIKSIFNNGDWALDNNDVSFSRKDYTKQYADLDPKTRAIALAKGHVTPPTIKDRLQGLLPNFRERVVQATFDRFRSVRDISEKAYQMLRLSNGPQDGAVSTLLHYGQVFNDDGALNIKKGTQGLLDILKPVGNEVDRFLLWIAANRAENLAKEERERFFSADEIKALKALDKNSMPDGRSRYAVYRETLRQMNELNKSVLDVARDTGLINETAYKKFSQDIWYIPFYRQMEDDKSLSGAQTSSAAVGQYLSKQLKGSERPLNDLMENVLMNWSHILSASMKNQAAVETLGAATQMGGIVSRITPLGKDNMGKDPQGNVVTLKGTVKVMEKGETVHYRIDDDLLFASLDAVANMPSYGFWTETARGFKTTLTRFISLSPTFKINNLIRDSIQSIGVSGLSKDPVSNVMQGFRLYRDDRAEALAGGGLFAMGNAFDGDRAANVKHLIKRGVPSSDIWTTEEKVKEGLKNFWDKYDEFSDAMENANRVALYKQMREKGASHLEASYAARDLQDFSLQGSAVAIRYMSQILPYFNARLQGLYKLGRDGLDPVVQVLSGNANESEQQKAAKFSAVLGAITLFGVMLYLAQKDDEDYDKLEDWERDSFFWIKVPGTKTAVRIPKPFEMGAFETVVERLTEQMVNDKVEGKVFGKRLLAVLSDNLAINPVPQIVRPLYDIARNKDGFTDRAIESMGMERMSKGERVNPGTSAAAVGLSKVNGLFADFASTVTGGAVNAQNMQFSPIQYDYMIRNYLGWLGTAIQTSSSIATMPFKDGASSRFERIDDFLVVGNYVKTIPQSSSKYVTGFFENAQTAAMAVADMQHYVNLGQIEKAEQIAKDNRDKIGMNKVYTKAEKVMSNVAKQIKMVEDDPKMPGDMKRSEIERLQQLRIQLAKDVEQMRKDRATK